MEEVPRPQPPFLALDDQERLAGENEEALLVVLVVVHRHGLARLEDADVEADSPHLGLALEERLPPALAVVPPASVLGVEDEPPLAGGDPAVLRVPERRLGHLRHGSHSSRNSAGCRPGKRA